MSDKKLTTEQLIAMLDGYDHKELHVHHTWLPDHSGFTGANHQAMQDSMRRYHIDTNGWSDIGQHVTLYPDGSFLTGRDFDRSPASIKGYNTGSFAVEMIGNFDTGNDVFEGDQKASMIKLAAYFEKSDGYVRFHRENASKTCPGTSIDKVDFMVDVYKYIIQENIGYSNPDAVWELMDPHQYKETLYKKWANSYN